MSHFLATLYDLRWIIATALLIWAAAWTVCKVIEFDRAAEERRGVKDAVRSQEPLPAVDAPEAEFEAWVARAGKKEKSA